MAKRSTWRAPIETVHDERRRKKRLAADLARRLTKANRAHRVQMLENMYRVILEYAKNSDISAQSAARAFAKAQRTVSRSPYRLGDALDFEVMLNISEALKAWYTEPEYLDSLAAPAPLPLSGPKSVENLIARFLPKSKARETAQWLLDERVLRRLSTGHLVPLRRSITFLRPNAMTLDRIPFLLQGLLSTVTHNTEAAARGGDTRCEQMLTLNRFRMTELPHFNRKVKTLAPLLLNQIESWAAPYLESEDSRPRRKTARVGVEVFTYVEEHGLRAKRGKNP